MSNPTALVQKLWNYCNILRDDGLSYGDYVEQLTFLLFLKMADEQARPPLNKPSAVPYQSVRRSLRRATIRPAACATQKTGLFTQNSGFTGENADFHAPRGRLAQTQTPSRTHPDLN